MPSKNDLVFNLGAKTDEAVRITNAFFQNELVGQAEVSKRKVDEALGSKINKSVVIKYIRDEATGKWGAVAEAQELGSAVDKINKDLDKLNNLQDGSVTRLRQQANEAKQARDQLARVEIGRAHV